MTETTGSSHPKEKGFDLREPSTCVLIVEDFEPMRQYLRSAVQQRPEFRIVAEVADGIDAVAGQLQARSANHVAQRAQVGGGIGYAAAEASGGRGA